MGRVITEGGEINIRIGSCRFIHSYQVIWDQITPKRYGQSSGTCLGGIQSPVSRGFQGIICGI